MDAYYYYKFLKRAKIPTERAKLSPSKNEIYAHLSSVEYVDENTIVINEVLRCIRIQALPMFDPKHVGPVNTKYNYRLVFLEGFNTKLVTQNKPYSKGRASSGRVPHHLSAVPQWIEKLAAEDKLNYFDEFDIDPLRNMKVVVKGAATKYSSHSTPLIDIIYRPGIELVDNLLTCIDSKKEGGMSREEVAHYLHVDRTGERADWWFIYQVSLKTEHVSALKEAPWRTFVIHRETDILLVIPVAYPNASGPIKASGSRVWDPF